MISSSKTVCPKNLKNLTAEFESRRTLFRKDKQRVPGLGELNGRVLMFLLIPTFTSRQNLAWSQSMGANNVPEGKII